MDSRSWPCPPCDEIREFVQPPCGDGHVDDGGECPEWICVACGAALLIENVSVTSAVEWARVAA